MENKGPDAARADTDDEAEARMRHALSLMRGDRATVERRPTGHGPVGGGHGGGTGAARRHRFVQDGEVPVSMVRPRRDLAGSPLAGPGRERDVVALRPDELQAERTARHDAERRLQDQSTAFRSVQTRLGDAEARLADAATARDALLAELAELRAAHASLEEAHAALLNRTEADGSRADTGALARRRGRPPRVPEADNPGAQPEPFKWWD